MKLSEQMRETAKAAEGIGKHDTAGRWHQYADNAAALEAEVEKLRRINSEAAVELARRKEKP